MEEERKVITVAYVMLRATVVFRREVQKSSLMPSAHHLAVGHELFSGGNVTECLTHLGSVKADASLNHSSVDYLRALCFLQQGDALQARQALLEELRHTPSHREARSLMLQIESRVSKFLDPPSKILTAEPLFSLLYDCLKPHTMLTWPRLFSLYMLAKTMCETDLPGDVVECGCAGGGSLILIAVVCKQMSKRPRQVFGCDSFVGMPPPTPKDHITTTPAEATHWSRGTCSGSQSHIETLAQSFDVKVNLVSGWFADTLPPLVRTTPHSSANMVKGIGLLHCDADWYESTKTVLTCLMPQVVAGGGVQIDDYHYWDGCKAAVDEVLEDNCKALLQSVDGNAVAFRTPFASRR
jgi:hypothetical protein